MDRGLGTTKSKSPIRYTVTGATGSRILKLEYFNAGFYEENVVYSTFADSVNIQVWLYEGSNIVEFHYGPSRVTHPTDYFWGAGPIPSYLMGCNFMTFDIQKIYYLKGNPATPTLDTTKFPFITPPTTLNNYPANGTVYRYTPKTLSVKTISLSLDGVAVYPNTTTGLFEIDNKKTVAISYEIVSATGQFIEKKSVAANAHATVDLSNVSAGMYLVNIAAEDGAATYKIMKH